MLKFKDFLNDDIILEIKKYLDLNILIESTSDIVYKNDKTDQYVTLSKHALTDREHRAWWKSYNDKNFTEFVRYILSILYNGYQNKLKGKGTFKDIKFSFGEEFAFVSPDRRKALIISLRPTSKDENTSFSITTILNMDSPDMNQKRDIITRIDKSHEKTLDNFKLTTESINARIIHVIQL